MTRAGAPTEMVQGGQSRVTTEFAPIAAPSPIVTPGRTTEFAPTTACFPMRTKVRIGVRYAEGTVGPVRLPPL